MNTSHDKETIEQLAALSAIEYDRKRIDIAKSMGISVLTLDRSVKEAKRTSNEKVNDIFPSIEPWHESVSLSMLLDSIEQIFNRTLVFHSEHEAKAIALWVVHTYCLDAATVSPILYISSPEKRCGKSTLLSVLQKLINRPLVASNITAAALFRSIEKFQPTLVIDEGDTFIEGNEELRGVINSGHTRALAYTLRCVGDEHEPTRFCTWGAKVIAGIGHLPETIEDRSIIIQLRRKLLSEKKEKLRNISDSIFHDLARKCVRFKNDNLSILAAKNPEIPETLNDRAADNWIPLLAIAELAGGNWIKSALDAAKHLCGLEQEPISTGAELLNDIRNIFDDKRIDRLSTRVLLGALHSVEEAPWRTYNRGKPLSARQLAKRLKEYKIHSKDMRLAPSNKNLKGYCLEDFQEAFSRYIPSSFPDPGATSATTLQSRNDED